MILLDANLVLYAVNEGAPLHRKAKTWLADDPAELIPQPSLRGIRMPLGCYLVGAAVGSCDSPCPASHGHLAVLAIEQEGELCSSDNDFSRFKRLKWRNPLA